MVSGVRAALAVAGLAGVVLLVLATFATVIEITVAGNANITADIDRTASGWDRHGPALLLLAGLAAVMLLGALRGGRPAMFALAAAGLAVLLIAVVGDAPDLDKTGRIGELYEDAQAEAGSGFYLESLGGALLLIAGVGLLVVGAGTPTAPAGRRGAAPGDEERTPAGGAGVAARRIGAEAASAVAPGPEATDVPTTADSAPGPSPDATARLSFEERLRQARERARRKS